MHRYSESLESHKTQTMRGLAMRLRGRSLLNPCYKARLMLASRCPRLHVGLQVIASTLIQ